MTDKRKKQHRKCQNEVNGRLPTEKEIKATLSYLRKEIVAERISYGEIAGLQSLAKYIDPSDIQLLEWAGVKESK